MNKNEKILAAFTQDTALPDIVTQKTDEAFSQILAGAKKESAARYVQHAERSHKKTYRKRFPTWAKAASAAAAALILAFGFCAANPVLAARLPVIGHLFTMLAKDSTFSGDYAPYAEPLEEVPEPSGSAATSSWSQTAGDVTVTMSEVYCNQESLSLSMLIESTEPFQDKIMRTESGSQSLSLNMDTVFSFNPEVYVGSNCLEGRFLDEKSFAGIWRVNLDEVLLNQSELTRIAKEAEASGEDFIITEDILDQYAQKIELPDHFDITISLKQIIGDLADQTGIDWGMSTEELEALPDEEFEALHAQKMAEYGMDQYPNKAEHYWFDGPWNFTIPVTVNASGNQEISINDKNESGVGLNKISVTPFELHIDYAHSSIDCIPIVLDAQGNWMEFSDSVQILPIAGHDIARITVYLCEFEQWVNELNKYSHQEDFRQYLENCALYSREVDLSCAQ